MDGDAKFFPRPFSPLFLLLTFTLMLLLSMFAVACSTKVIKRDSRGVKLPAPMNDLPAMRKKLALLTFFNEGQYGGDDLGIIATEELRAELGRSQEFIVDTEDANVFGPSKEVYSGGGWKLTLLSKKARLSGINLVVFGRVVFARIREKMDEVGFVRETKSYAESKVEVKIFDVASNKEVYSEVLDGYANDTSYKFYLEKAEDKEEYKQELLRYVVKVAIRKSIPKVVEISSRMSWTGRVAKIIGSKIYVNAGRKSGLQIGDVLKVVTEGHEVFDPENGGIIGTTQGEVKGTLEIIDYFGPDGAVSLLHSGGAVSEGDFVQLY
ncbi:MAG: hypothetical protein HQK50_12695 [Oligoflexia bacterium]|nr:hypothetical protein [Oligoflexia bacterium]MBF0366422.1 hypothetical protein [Oligoflexia bacterium]